MIKLLKLGSLLAVIIALLVLVLTGIGLYRGNDASRERNEFLSKETVIDKLRELKSLPDRDKNKTSPLVVQAGILADRIDPYIPPPPKPREKPTVTHRNPVTTKPETVTPPQPPKVKVKFDLLATCYAENNPDKSLALLDITGKGSEWVRQGEQVGLQVIHEIKPGSIVVYQGGKLNGELQVPTDDGIASLLKSENPAAAASGKDALQAAMDLIKSANNARKAASPGTRTTPTARSGRQAVTNPRTSRPGRRAPTTNRNVRSLPKKPSPEELEKERKKSLNNIDNIIKETKNNPTPESKSNAEIWESVRELLKSAGKSQEAQKKGSSKTKNK